MSNPLSRAVRILAGQLWPEPSPRKLRSRVAGQTVLVTGASSGIGEATALRLADAGAKVLLVARRQELLERVADQVQERGGKAFVYPADLSDVAQVEALVEAVLADHGSVDIVINNAGRSIRRSVEQSYHRFHDYTRTIDVNYLGPVRLMLGLLPSMRERGRGHLINISSAAVDLPAPNWSAYTASKSAFETWLRCVAPEVRADGVRTTSIHFGLVFTAMSAPTEQLRNLPGMSADEAAGAVCLAVAWRPRLLRPWWAGFWSLSDQTPWLTDWVLTTQYRRETRGGRARLP